MRMFMVGVLILVGVGAFAIGGQFMSVAQSAVHEIEGMIAFLIGTTAIGCATITLAVEKMREDVSRGVHRTATATTMQVEPKGEK